MENHEEDDLEELRSTVYIFPQDVQKVIEQVRFIATLLSNYLLNSVCHDDVLSFIDILFVLYLKRKRNEVTEFSLSSLCKIWMLINNLILCHVTFMLNKTFFPSVFT